MKLDKNINHHQTIMQNKNPLIPSTVFTELCPFIIFSMETDPFFNFQKFQTIADIFTKLGSYIKHCQLMVRE